jgi:replicative DNA helicase
MIDINKEIELASYDGEDKVISSVEFKKELDESGSLKAFGFSSGIQSLDKFIDGFQVGELITISGPTGQGKTTFSHSLTKNFEEKGIESLWFSYEVIPSQMFEKFAKAKIFYLPRKLKDRDWKWMQDRIDESMIKYPKVKAVFIDHLHYLVDMEKINRNSSIEVGSVIRDLKRFAVDREITIFLMAHMTKTRYDVAPTESDLRDSSFVAQESDKVLIVWRERKLNQDTRQYDFSGKTLVIVSKDRRTGSLGSYVKLDFVNGELIEQSTEYDKTLDEITL